jgi:D-inositol-3-phosphate glycosyltransferase
MQAMPSAISRLSVLGALPPYRGGIAHFTTTTALGLRARGYEVQPLTFTRQYPGLLFPGKSQFAQDSEEPVETTRCLDSIGPWSWWRTASLVRDFAPQAILFNHWMPFFAPAYGTVARRIDARATRRICLAHNAIPHERRLGDNALSRYFFRACDGFITLSAEVERDLRQLGITAPVRQVEHPIYDIFGEAVPKPDARQRLDLDPNRPTLLFFGYVRPYKGLDVLIEALAEARLRRPELQLLVVGEFYEGEQRTRDRIVELKLQDHIRLVAEYVPDDEVRYWFSASDVVVQPYLSATQSGVAQIAFQFERPMILTDVGGLAEIVPHEEAGFVVPPGDASALAAELDRFFDGDWAERLQAGVRRSRDRFSWDRLYEALEELTGLEPPR